MAAEFDKHRSTRDGGAPSDEDLVRRALSGEQSAYGELSDRYRRPLFNAAFRILGSKEDAQDVAQEAIVKALCRLERFDLDRRFFSWIYRIAINEALDRSVRADRFSGEEVEDLLATGAVAATGQRRLEEAEVREGLHRCILQLPLSDRSLIVLHYLAEMPYADIAETLDLPLEKVRSRLFSARRRLRILLENEAGTAGS